MSAHESLSSEQFDTVMHPVSDLLPLADQGAHDDYVPAYAADMKAGKWNGSHPEEPVNVHTWNDGGRFLMDGSHRVLAARQAGLSHLPTLLEHHADEPTPTWVRSLLTQRAHEQR